MNTLNLRPSGIHPITILMFFEFKKYNKHIFFK